MKVLIRRATIEDVKVLAAHRVGMFLEMKSVAPERADALRSAAIVHLHDAMQRGEYLAWVACLAEKPNTIVGGAGVQLRRLLPRPDDSGQGVLSGREGIVLNVYVDAEHRRTGIARSLMKAILDWAPGAQIVRLVLHASDDGRRLYEKLGFVPTNEMRYTGALAP